MWILLSLLLAAGEVRPSQTVVVVVGASGAKEYEEPFNRWADRWQDAATAASAKCIRIGSDDGDNRSDRDRLADHLAKESTRGEDVLWLVLIGHGTFDGDQAKFNMRGVDISAEDLDGWLKPTQRPVVIVNCASSSGPFIHRLSGSDRVIVTATRSGYEQNFARFGDYFSQAINDPGADLDKDEQTSVLEAYLSASAQVEAFYADEGRLATEHALLDDNGDQLATPASWFRGTRAVKRPKKDARPDGRRANQVHLVRNPQERELSADQRLRRDELEREIELLRDQKPTLKEDNYYDRLEAIVVRLAEIYEESSEE